MTADSKKQVDDPKPQKMASALRKTLASAKTACTTLPRGQNQDEEEQMAPLGDASDLKRQAGAG